MTSASKSLVVSVGALGFACGWLWHKQTVQPVKEGHAPAQRQSDGSMVLERQQGGSAVPAAPHAIPAGGKEERRVQVVVKTKRGVVRTVQESLTVPDAPASKSTTGDLMSLDHAVQDHEMVDSCDCPPVTVDLSLVRMPDQSRRVVASSPDGAVVSGLDIPLEPIQQVMEPSWIASGAVMLDASGARMGAMLQHRRGPAVIGAGLLISPIGSNPAGIISAGITW